MNDARPSGGLYGVGVVARGKDGTGHRVDVLPFGATFVGNDAGGGEAPRARDDLESFGGAIGADENRHDDAALARSEEHTSELQSLMRISYADFCLKKKTNQNRYQYLYTQQ